MCVCFFPVGTVLWCPLSLSVWPRKILEPCLYAKGAKAKKLNGQKRRPSHARHGPPSQRSILWPQLPANSCAKGPSFRVGYYETKDPAHVVFWSNIFDPWSCPSVRPMILPPKAAWHCAVQRTFNRSLALNPTVRRTGAWDGPKSSAFRWKPMEVCPICSHQH